MRFSAPEDVIALTPLNPFGRSADGRPNVPTTLLERLKLATIEEAWSVLSRKHEYHNQFEGSWINMHPERILIGRALTAEMIPTRPDLDDVVKAQGEKEGRRGSQNNWVIQSVGENDVVVVNLFGKIKNGTFVGDNLATAISSKKGGGLVVDGAVRDPTGIAEVPSINVFCRGFDPTAIKDLTLTSINGPIRIGQATVLPGDIVLGTPAGIIFIPPHLAEEVAKSSEDTRLRDRFGKQMLREGKYTSGQIDVMMWEPEIEADFKEWQKKNPK